MLDPTALLPLLLGLAVISPLVSFFFILAFGPRLGHPSRGGLVATTAIVTSALLSFVSFFIWIGSNPPVPSAHHGEDEGHVHGVEHSQSDLPRGPRLSSVSSSVKFTPVALVQPGEGASSSDSEKSHAAEVHAGGDDTAGHDTAGHDTAGHDTAGHDTEARGDSQAPGPVYYAGEYWTLGQFGQLRLTIGYYIDALTVCMFCMVTLIASCIHFYAMGYMHDELHDITDHEVTLSNGAHLTRPGRFYRFFQYLSLFCFSMLGLVLAGNVAMVFVFWELVGICSYFLIGFYIERKSASNAANKAFIVNRVGDFGMIIGLVALWSSLGTFNFGDTLSPEGTVNKGLFSLIRPESSHHALIVPDGMVRFAAKDEVGKIVRSLGPAASPEALEEAVASHVDEWRTGKGPSGKRYGYWLLVIAGVGIFCGCVGKSAQFPLHVWLPDAMEGPTPVSALVHSATMVAAGVYLVGRFYPAFAPEVLLVIAIIGCITLFMAATIAITAVDIKRVLAYSTVSQLGYMMLALGVGGWAAGLTHLITHAFFKSLLFLCSGSVIHAVHTNDMREMGGLRKKMPITAYTMLVGCLAIAGVSVPFVVGFSGYYSKDAILEQAWSFAGHNQSFLATALFWAAAGGAGITAFYMFRMWCMTFMGTPRNADRYDHAHESPRIMYMPLVVLSVFATAVAWKPLEALIGGGLALAGSLWLIARNRHEVEASAASGHGHAQADAAHSHAGHSHEAHSHGHDSHGHDSHGHDSHGHDSHGHDSHGHSVHADGPARWLYFPFNASAIVLVIAVLGILSPRLGNVVLENLLAQAHPAGLDGGAVGALVNLQWPAEHLSHAWAIKFPVTMLATGTALGGIAFAVVMYGLGWLNPEEVRRQFAGIYRFLWNKWYFDELYHWVFVRPAHGVAGVVASFDRQWIDGLIHGIASSTRRLAFVWDRLADRTIIDGLVNLIAAWTYRTGLELRNVQTGRVRQYVMFIVVGAIAIFVLISFFWNSSLAG